MVKISPAIKMAVISLPPLISTIIPEIFWVVATVLLVIGCALLFLFSTPIFLFRLILPKLARIFRPDLGPLIGIDCNIFSSELVDSAARAPRCSIVKNSVFNKNVPVEVARKRVENFMVNRRDPKTGQLLYPEFKQYVTKWCGFSFWKDDPNFDMNHHVKSYNQSFLNENDNLSDKDKIVTPEDLRNLIEYLMNKKYEPQRSPWECYWVNNYKDDVNGDRKSVMVVRFHHALCDGYSILYALVEGFLNTPLSTINLPTPNIPKKKETIWSYWTIPFRLLSDLKEGLLKGYVSHPWKVPDNKKAWRHNCARSKGIPLGKIKEIKNSMKVGFTSVILAAAASAVSKVMKRSIAKKGEGIPERTLMLVPVPLPKHPNALRNHATVLIADLPVQDFTDPRMRVRACEEMLLQRRKSFMPHLARFLADACGLFPANYAGFLIRNRTMPMGISNMPSSSSSQVLKMDEADAEVESIEFAAGGQTGCAGVALTCISYGKHLRFNVTAEASLLSRSDVDDLMQFIWDEVELLHKIVC